LMSHLLNHSILVAAVQEPYTINNIVPSNAPYRVISDGPSLHRTRAAIIVSSQINAIHLSQFTTRDLCACTISIGGTTLTIISVYIPPPQSADGPVPIEPYLDKVEDIVRNVGGNILVLGDFNSHHSMWGSPRTFDRGPKVCDFISVCDLHLLNSSNTPTFYTVRD